jgi:hypothetical protein
LWKKQIAENEEEEESSRKVHSGKLIPWSFTGQGQGQREGGKFIGWDS